MRHWCAREPSDLQRRTGQRIYRCGKSLPFLFLIGWIDRSLFGMNPSIKDRYKRFVAICFCTSGDDIGAWMVQNGNALDWPRYSKGKYYADQHKNLLKIRLVFGRGNSRCRENGAKIKIRKNSLSLLNVPFLIDKSIWDESFNHKIFSNKKNVVPDNKYLSNDKTTNF